MKREGKTKRGRERGRKREGSSIYIGRMIEKKGRMIEMHWACLSVFFCFLLERRLNEA